MRCAKIVQLVNIILARKKNIRVLIVPEVNIKGGRGQPVATVSNCESLFTFSFLHICNSHSFHNFSFFSELKKGCKAGTYSTELGAASNSTCIDCPKGQYSSATAVSSEALCNKCAAGKKNPNNGSTLSADCTDCGPNTKSEVAGSSDCVDCDVGKSSNNGSTECQACVAGMFSNATGAASVKGLGLDCKHCDAGQYRQRFDETETGVIPTNPTFCVDCPDGWSSETGSTKCQACGAGTYGNGCQSCATGQYRNGSDPVATSCRNCTTGFYNDVVGQGSCLPCIPGEFNDKEGAVKCQECRNNSFSTLKHRTAPCDDCAAGRTSDPGSTKCSVCAAGKIVNTSTNGCSDCLKGEYRGGTDDITKCLKCLPGYYTSDVGQGSCLPCIPGEFNDVTGAVECKLCRKNSFSTEKHRQVVCDQCATGRASRKGSTKCSDCAPGKFKNMVNNEEVCTECPIGFAQGETDQSFCTQCKKGKEAPTLASSFCAACDLGKFNLIDGQDCLNCPAGQYQDGKGETACKDCDVDTYLTELGKSSKADCLSCDEKRSTGASVGNVKDSACLCKHTLFYQSKENMCQPCPDGADCSANK